MLLALLRALGCAIADGLVEWRAALRRSSRHYRHLPDAEMPLHYRG